MLTGSKKELVDLIKRKGTLSLDEAVAHTTLAKTTLREHFSQLERDGYIRHGYVRKGPGRPSLEYQLTQKGNSLFPSYESALIRELLRFLKKEGNENTIERFFESFWEKRLEQTIHRMESASADDINTQIKVLAQILDEEGFMPEINLDESREMLSVKECNCPFSEVIKETRLPCKLEAMFYEKLFERETKRSAYIAEGDFSCTYEISLNEEIEMKNRFKTPSNE